MKKQTMKQLRLGMAVLALCGMSAVGGGQTFAEDTVASLAARVAALEQATGVGDKKTANITIGADASVTSKTSIAIGNHATATDGGKNRNIAIGNYAMSSNNDSTAIGTKADAAGFDSVALGSGASTTINNTIAIGHDSSASGQANIAIGQNANAGLIKGTDYDAINLQDGDTKAYYKKVTKPEGTEDTDTSWYDVEVNKEYYKKVSSDNAPTYSVALGVSAKAKGTSAVALGSSAQATAEYAMAMGNTAKATELSAVAIGGGQTKNGKTYGAQASGQYSVALGVGTQATNTSAIALGGSAIATNTYAVAMGDSSNASGDSALALGRNSIASQSTAVALGYKASSTAESGVALGRETSVTGQYGVALGRAANSQGAQSVALGYSTTASGAQSIALGNKATASADNAIAIGNGASVAVANAIALGQGSKVASGDGNVLSIGTKGNERKIIHVADGTANYDAANYGQLLKTATYTLQSSNNYSVTLQTNNGSNGPTIKLDVDGLKTNAGTTTTNADAASVSLNNINSEGIAKIASAVQVKAGDDSVKVTTGKDNNGNVTYTITSTGGGSVTGGGKIAEGDDKAVSGDTVYKALGELSDSADYKTINAGDTVSKNLAALDSGKANTDLSNLSKDGKSQVKSLAQEAVKVTGGSGITVTGSDSPASDGNITYNVSLNYDAIKGAGGVGGGKVESDDANLVSGETMYSELRPTNGSYVKNGNSTAENLNALDTAIGADSGYGTKLNNISTITKYKEGDVDKERQTTLKENIGALDKAMGDVSNLTNANTGVKGIDGKVIGGEGGKYSADLTGAVQAVNDKVGDFDTTEVLKDEKGTALKDANGNDLRYHQLKSGLSVVQNMERFDQYMGDVNSLAGDDDGAGAMKDVNGDKVTKDQLAQTGLTGVVQLMDAKIGDLPSKDDYAYKGAIKSGVSVNDNLVNIDKAIGTDEDYGSELYNISTGDNVSLKKNIGALDAAIGTTADGAFVSSTNSVGQNLNALDRGLSDLGDRVNKVGAGAAALSALHVQDFDPDNKLNFAVGFGHYKNANAGAIGAFYKPNHDTTFSIASTIGNGDNMLNAGISFKIGTSSHVEKTMVVKADYEALQKKVADQDKRLAAQDERLASQDAQIEELKKQVAALIARG